MSASLSGERTRLARWHWRPRQCELWPGLRAALFFSVVWGRNLRDPEEGFGEGAETDTRGRVCSPDLAILIK
jgi:hypothetical protein